MKNFFIITFFLSFSFFLVQSNYVLASGDGNNPTQQTNDPLNIGSGASSSGQQEDKTTTSAGDSNSNKDDRVHSDSYYGDTKNGDNSMQKIMHIKQIKPLPGSEKLSTEGGALGILKQYVKVFYIFGSGFVSLIAVFWIAVGGYEIMWKGSMSSGDVTAGKEKIMNALLGLVLVFLSGLILNTINPGFFVL